MPLLMNACRNLSGISYNKAKQPLRSWLVSLLDHSRLKRHMFKLKLAEKATCRFFLIECEGLVRLRFPTLGEANPPANSYTIEAIPVS